ncbi:hypothetical protein VIGAN_09090400, partial [Vigna angularis var. angularis]
PSSSVVSSLCSSCSRLLSLLRTSFQTLGLSPLFQLSTKEIYKRKTKRSKTQKNRIENHSRTCTQTKAQLQI